MILLAGAKNCAELYNAGVRSNGVYLIDPGGSGDFHVYCDQTTSGGGWTVFQKRLDGSADFYRTWYSYKYGFGNTNSEFWLGLESVRRLTNSGGYKLRIDLEDFSGNTVYAEYTWFKVESEGSNYTLRIGSYSGKLAPGLVGWLCHDEPSLALNKQSASPPFNKTLFWRRLEAI